MGGIGSLNVPYSLRRARSCLKADLVSDHSARGGCVRRSHCWREPYRLNQLGADTGLYQRIYGLPDTQSIRVEAPQVRGKVRETRWMKLKKSGQTLLGIPSQDARSSPRAAPIVMRRKWPNALRPWASQNMRDSSERRESARCGMAWLREDREALAISYGWEKPRKIVVNSMSDLFHEGISDEFILKVWKVMRETPRHNYQTGSGRASIGRSRGRCEARHRVGTL